MKIWVFENQVASDGYADIAQRRLSEGLSLGAIDENLRPGLRVDLDGDIERDHCRDGFVLLDSVCHGLTHVLVAIFERLIPDRQYDCRAKSNASSRDAYCR